MREKTLFFIIITDEVDKGSPPGLGCLDSPGAKERMKIRCESTKKGRGAKHCFSSCTGVCWRLEKTSLDIPLNILCCLRTL